MSRIEKRFSDLASKNRKALITYVVAGDPSLDMTNTLMHEMVASGADLPNLECLFQIQSQKDQLYKQRTREHLVTR